MSFERRDPIAVHVGPALFVLKVDRLGNKLDIYTNSPDSVSSLRKRYEISNRPIKKFESFALQVRYREKRPTNGNFDIKNASRTGRPVTNRVDEDRYLSNRNITNKKISHSNKAQCLDATQIGPKGFT